MKLLARLMLCFMLSFTMVELPIMKAHAGMITTSQVAQNMNRTAADANVTKFLDRTDVKDQLVKLGVNPEEATRRIASLSDAEVSQLDQDIQKATIGGDVGGILVLVLVVILIIYFAKRI
jgi:hypothetical protein